MKINENLLRYREKETRTGVSNSTLFYNAYMTPTENIKDKTVSVSADIDLENNPTDGGISIVFRIHNLDNSMNYKAGTVKYVHGQRTKWENLNFKEYSNVSRIEVGFYVGETPKTLGVTGTIQNIKLELGAEATMWTPAHADMTPEQIALMKYGEFEEARQI